jgi:hypothetical protein
MQCKLSYSNTVPLVIIIILVAIGSFYICKKGIADKWFSLKKSENFDDSYDYVYTSGSEPVKHIDLTSETSLSSGKIVLSEERLRLKINSYMPDGSDYKSGDDSLVLMGDSEVIGKIKRSREGWYVLDIPRPKNTHSRYTVVHGETVVLSSM